MISFKFVRSVIILLLLSSTFVSKAQEDASNLLQESVDDGEKLLSAYLSPFMKSVSLGMNQGWYNTAKPHKLFGVDLTATVSFMQIPNSQLFYDATKLGLKQVELSTSSPGYPQAPTIFGPDKTPVFNSQSNPSETFEGAPGIDLKGSIGKNWMPVPMVHLGIGLPKNTDLKIRFIPSIDLGDGGSLKMIGFGVMHDIKQYIPAIKHLPFDLSGLVGYTRLNLDYKTQPADQDVAGENQRGEFVMSATTIQGVISKKISVLTVYGGVGYNIAKSHVAFKGTYDFNEDGDFNDAREKDPLDLRYAASGLRATAGFRLKLAVITLHADYTLQKYKALTVGFGINVR
jgi:hypothetical protein